MSEIDAAPTADELSSSLAVVATRGGLLLSGANVVAIVLSISGIVVLAHILPPRAFGLAALAFAVADVLFLIASLSLPTILIREPEPTVLAAFQTVVALMVVLTLLALIVAAGAAILFATFESAQLGLFFFLISVGRVSSMWGLCFGAELERRLAYRAVSAVRLVGVLVSLAVALALAVATRSIWALAGRDIALSFTTFLLYFWFSRWRVRSFFDFGRTIAFARLGANLVAARLAEVLFHRFDNFTVGVLAGLNQLGLYNQAYVLAEMGNTLSTPISQQVTLATYSRMQGDRRRTSDALNLIVYFLVRLSVPLALLYVLVPRELLGVVLGQQWKPAAPILRVLSVYALLIPLFVHLREVLIANGKVRAALAARSIQLLFFLPATVVGVWLDRGEGASIAVAGGMIIGTVVLIRAVHQIAQLSYRSFGFPALAGGAASAAALLALTTASGDLERLFVGGLALLAVYGSTLLIGERSLLRKNARFVWAAVRDTPGAKQRRMPKPV